MTPRKLLYLVNTLGTGGTERNVRMICRFIDQSRYKPEVWVLKEGFEYEEEVRSAGITIRNLDRRWSRNPWFALKTAWKIAREEADIVHAFLPAIASYGALGRLMFGFPQPFVMSIGTTKFPSPKEIAIFKRFFTRTIDHILANSASVAGYARELGFAADEISVIANGHDLRPYQRPLNKDAIRAALGIRPDELMLISVGRLIDTKRIEDLIDAIQILATQGRKFRVVMVGDGPEQQKLQARIDAAGITDHFLFLGNRRDVPDLLRVADMFVFPSEVEGLPNSIIEAGLARLPIVACDIPGVNDILHNEEQALLVPTREPRAFAAAIQRYLDDPEYAATMARRADELTSENYTIQLTLNKLYAVYDRLLGEPENLGAANPAAAPCEVP